MTEAREGRSPRHPRRDVGVYRRIAGEARVCVMSAESAEICKLASNCFRTTKISFANMAVVQYLAGRVSTRRGGYELIRR